MRFTYSTVGLMLFACILMLTLTAPLHAAAACRGFVITKALPKATGGQTISTTQELSAALKNAQGGETFLLAGGNYGALRVRQSFKKPVTIRSADPQSPACLTELRVTKSSNITFDGLVFDYVRSPGDKVHVIRFEIRNSHGITISNSIFDGDYNAGTGFGRGIFIRDSSKITISGNILRKWLRAITAVHTTFLTIRGNQIYDIRADGMAFSGIDDVLIERNTVHNFRAGSTRDHRDMIQLMRTTNTRSTNVVIRDNVFDMGAGDYTQTIFMGASGKDTSNPQLRHQNILIENNVIYNAHLHGISVHGVDDLSIRKNSIIRIPISNSGQVTIPRINVSSSTSVVIEQNAVSEIVGYENQRDWAVVNNALIQDLSPSRGGYYNREFIVYKTGSANGFHEYGVRPGSEVDRLKAGSTLVRNYPTQR
ncbi:right-handed parallel beta-helix repeat-containing protein [Ruegeria sp.]|uniref:right-handed parallel beta-helix repeat-containing protein n=1 Tax=Ruegeria sp. TaxID=1879320 RepID=UPI003C7B6369